MKILIIGFTKPKYMPYMNFYLDNISANRNEIHILYWNRDRKDEDLTALTDYTLYEFDEFQADEVPVYTKIGSFLKYRRFASKIIRKGKYDFIIVLHSLPGILVIDKLRRYADKYIFDYRDSTYEKFAPFKKVVELLVKWSRITFVSSDAFRRYLPQNEANKIITSHNILFDSLNHQQDKECFGIPSDKIRIAFWGFIRHKDVNLKLIERLSNDNRFELHYYGREQQIALDLKEYAKTINAENVFFHGEYIPSDRYQFILQTDIIHNIYMDNNTMLAMGNKYYDGIIFRIPQLCMPESFMAEMCEKHGVGIAIDPNNEKFADILAEYYYSMDYHNFKCACIKALSEVIDEYNRGCNIVKSYTDY